MGVTPAEVAQDLASLLRLTCTGSLLELAEELDAYAEPHTSLVKLPGGRGVCLTIEEALSVELTYPFAVADLWSCVDSLSEEFQSQGD